MNQGKLGMVKQEMERLNIKIFGTSEVKWIEMGYFDLDGHYIYYCEQESLRRNHSQQGPKIQYLGAVSKTTE